MSRSLRHWENSFLPFALAFPSVAALADSARTLVNVDGSYAFVPLCDSCRIDGVPAVCFDDIASDGIAVGNACDKKSGLCRHS